MSECFNWDKFLTASSFRDVQKCVNQTQAYLSEPSMYSPDRKWLYAASLDVDCETDNEEGLISLLQALKQGYHESAEIFKNRPEHPHLKKQYQYWTDFNTVCLQIYDLNHCLEAKYGLPDELLFSDDI